MEIKLLDYGLDENQQYLMFDVFSNSYSRGGGSFSVNMEESSFRLFMLRRDPGVMDIRMLKTPVYCGCAIATINLTR